MTLPRPASVCGNNDIIAREPATSRARDAMPVHPQWVTTGLEFEGHRIVGHRGVVRGITVRSRNVVVNLGAAIQTLFGGNITLYTELCERARQEAFDLMLEHAT